MILKKSYRSAENASENKTYEKLGILILKDTSKCRIQTSIGGGGPRCPWLEWVVGGLPSYRRVFKNPPPRILRKLCYLEKSCSNLDVSWVNCTMIIYLHSIRCFPSLRNEKRHCCYNIITTISHVISSERIHGTEKYVWSGLLLLLKIPEIHLESHFKVSEWT